MPDSESMIEDGRAHHALQCAKHAREEGGSVADKYRSYAKDLPMRIKTNGLGAALAFVRAKSSSGGADGEAYRLLYEHLSDWLDTDARSYLLAPAVAESDDLVEQVVSLDSSAYRAVTREVLSLLSWLRRFADGLIDVSE